MLLHDHPHFMWKLSGLTLLLTLQIATTNVRMVMVIHGANRPPPTIQPRSNQPNSPSSLSHRVITTTEQNNLPFPSIMQPEQTSQQLERLSHPSLHYEPAVNKITLAEPATIKPIIKLNHTFPFLYSFLSLLTLSPSQNTSH